jgi:hypothetical protein
MNDFDFHRDAAGRRGASTGIRLSLAPGTVATQPSRLAVRAGGSGMNDTDRAVGTEAMR